MNSSVGIEFGFIMMLIWRHSFYYFFVSLFFSLVLLCIISGEVSIIVTYLSLLKFKRSYNNIDKTISGGGKHS
jgi:hypothetical protein